MQGHIIAPLTERVLLLLFDRTHDLLGYRHTLHVLRMKARQLLFKLDRHPLLKLGFQRIGPGRVPLTKLLCNSVGLGYRPL